MLPVDATKEERRAVSKAKAEECLAKWGKYLKPGVIITHTRCGASFEEHIFTHMDGYALCGYPTPDTYKITGMTHGLAANQTNDIHPSSVTHINRTALDAVDYVTDLYMAPMVNVNKLIESRKNHWPRGAK